MNLFVALKQMDCTIAHNIQMNFERVLFYSNASTQNQ